MSKRRKKTETQGRINIVLNDEIRELGEELGKMERRSLSNLITVLIEREGVRVGLREVKAA